MKASERYHRHQLTGEDLANAWLLFDVLDSVAGGERSEFTSLNGSQFIISAKLAEVLAELLATLMVKDAANIVVFDPAQPVMLTDAAAITGIDRQVLANRLGVEARIQGRKGASVIALFELLKRT